VSLSVDVRARFVSAAFEAGPSPLAVAGPSGAGKTSLLRLLAGLARPARGRIRCGDQVWFDSVAGVDVPVEERGCGYVFQDYALFPHLRAWQNVAFGARNGAGAFELLERFGLADRASAYPSELSGGERQRVALARALALRPRLLLLDEPLASLDPGTRLRAGRELAAVVAQAGIPALLVSHDFAEAATLAGEIMVLERGRVVQRGTAQELAAAPASTFVADFTGASVLPGVAVDGGDGLALVELEGGGTLVSADSARGPVSASVHPWEVLLEPPHAEPHGSAQNHLPARVLSVVPLGSRVRVALETRQGGHFLSAEVTEPAVRTLGLRPGAEVVATWKATSTRLATR
jgi:molybdate transport system ATP-binding protein